MTKLVVVYASVLVSLLALDAGWISWFFGAVFKPTLGSLVRDKPSFFAAGLFYVIYAGGLTYFAVLPNLTDSKLVVALLLGGAVGLICYSTYDFTNYATLRAWTLRLVILDVVWGTVMSALSAAFATWVNRFL